MWTLQSHYPILFRGVNGTVAHEFNIDLRAFKLSQIILFLWIPNSVSLLWLTESPFNCRTQLVYNMCLTKCLTHFCIFFSFFDNLIVILLHQVQSTSCLRVIWEGKGYLISISSDCVCFVYEVNLGILDRAPLIYLGELKHPFQV